MGYDLSLESCIRQSQLSRMCYVPVDRLDYPQLEEMVEAALLLKPMEYMYARTQYWEGLSEPERVLHCARALQRMHPDWVFASMTAALVWGLAVPEECIWPVRLATTRASSGHGNDTLLRQAVGTDKPCVVNRLSVTSLGRTVLDCLRELEFEDGLVLADSALALGELTHDELVDWLDEYRNTTRGGLHAVEIAKYAQNRTEEYSRLHARIAMLGYEVPEQLDGAWMGLADAELEAALDAAGVPRVPGGFALEYPDAWHPRSLNR